MRAPSASVRSSWTRVAESTQNARFRAASNSRPPLRAARPRLPFHKRPSVAAQNTSSHNHRCKSTWHHVSRTWTTQPRLTPRGQENQRGHVPLDRAIETSSQRRRMAVIRRFLERDPYEAIFGWSNARLGRWNVLSAIAGPPGTGFGEMRGREASGCDQSELNAVQRQLPRDPHMENLGNSAGTPSLGKTPRDSGYIFDPVTMRMVPAGPERKLFVATNIDCKSGRYQPASSDGGPSVSGASAILKPDTAASQISENESTKSLLDQEEMLFWKAQRQREKRLGNATQLESLFSQQRANTEYHERLNLARLVISKARGSSPDDEASHVPKDRRFLLQQCKDEHKVDTGERAKAQTDSKLDIPLAVDNLPLPPTEHHPPSGSGELVSKRSEQASSRDSLLGHYYTFVGNQRFGFLDNAPGKDKQSGSLPADPGHEIKTQQLLPKQSLHFAGSGCSSGSRDPVISSQQRAWESLSDTTERLAAIQHIQKSKIPPATDGAWKAFKKGQPQKSNVIMTSPSSNGAITHEHHAFLSLFLKEKPLKLMSGHELHNHRLAISHAAQQRRHDCCQHVPGDRSNPDSALSLGGARKEQEFQGLQGRNSLLMHQPTTSSSSRSVDRLLEHDQTYERESAATKILLSDDQKSSQSMEATAMRIPSHAIKSGIPNKSADLQASYQSGPLSAPRPICERDGKEGRQIDATSRHFNDFACRSNPSKTPANISSWKLEPAVERMRVARPQRKTQSSIQRVASCCDPNLPEGQKQLGKTDALSPSQRPSSIRTQVRGAVVGNIETEADHMCQAVVEPPGRRLSLPAQSELMGRLGTQQQPDNKLTTADISRSTQSGSPRDDFLDRPCFWPMVAMTFRAICILGGLAYAAGQAVDTWRLVRNWARNLQNEKVPDDEQRGWTMRGRPGQQRIPLEGTDSAETTGRAFERVYVMILWTGIIATAAMVCYIIGSNGTT